MVLFSRIPAPDWSAGNKPENEALCRKFPLPNDHDVNKDPWFHNMDEAAAICNGTFSGVVCPFREQCLHIALLNNEAHGIWAGTYPAQRKWIRRVSNIPKSAWDRSDEWRDTIPPPEFFEEDEDELAEEE